MKKLKKRLIVVLGMHRSGTSAITRGLQALGVALGDNLMPPVAANNEKGFWEDLDFNHHNIDLMHHLGCDWLTLTPIDQSAFERTDISPFRVRAVELLSSKTHDVPLFGVKDPRVARLLPHWKSVFAQIGVEVSYVIVLRHPISVACSLQRRDNLEPEYSYYLWLEHMVPAILESEGASRVVVDYDLLMDRPDEQLHRIAERLSLTNGDSGKAIAEYANEFLEERLRHTRFCFQDLVLDPAVPLEVLTAYECLDKIARDKLLADSTEIHTVFTRLAHRLQELAPAFSLLQRCQSLLISPSQTIATRDTEEESHTARAAEQAASLLQVQGQMTSLHQLLEGGDAAISALTHDLEQRDALIVSMQRSLLERGNQMDALLKQVEEREERIALLARSGADSDAYLSQLSGKIYDVQRKNDELTQLVEERAKEIEVRSERLKDRENEIGVLLQTIANRDSQLAAVYSSFGWKLLTRYRSILERAFPQHGRRRRIYELARKSAFILGRYGPRVLWRTCITYIRSRASSETKRVSPPRIALKIRAVEARTKAFSPLISVVFITKEQNFTGDFLPQQIAALRCQTIAIWEFLLLDLDTGCFLRVDGSTSIEDRGVLGPNPLALCRGTYIYSPVLDLTLLPANWLETNVLALEAQALLLTCNSLGGFPPAGHAAAPKNEEPSSRASRASLVYHRDVASEIDCSFSPTALLAHPYHAQQKVQGRVVHWHGTKGTIPTDFITLSKLLDVDHARLLEIDGFVTLIQPGLDAYLDVFPADLLVDPILATADKPFLLIHLPVLAMGGAEKLTYDLLANLTTSFNFVLFTTEKHREELGSTHAMFRALGVMVYDLGECATPPLHFSFVSYLIRKYNPSALFVANGSNFFYDFLPTIRAGFPSLRIVNQIFDHEAGWIDRYDRRVIEHVNIHIACNRKIQRAYLERLHIPEAKVAFIEHGIDLREFPEPACVEGLRSSCRQSFGIPQDRIIVAFVARMHPQKRPHDFLKLAKRLEGDKRFFFFMVGDGPLRKNIDDFINFYRLNNLKKLGFYTPVTDVLAAADVLVITSEYEGLPLVVLNALAMSVPVVSTEVGSIADVLSRHGAGKIVKAVGNIDLLADAVLQVATHLDTLRPKGPKTVHEAHDINDRAQDYMRVFLNDTVEGS